MVSIRGSARAIRKRSTAWHKRGIKMDCLRGFDNERLIGLVNNWGEKPFRAKQLYEWVHVKRVSEFSEMSNLPAGLRE